MAAVTKEQMLPIRVSRETHRALKSLAADCSTPMSALATQAIKAMLAKAGK